MERRVGDHRADRPQARRDPCGQRAIRPARQQHDWRSGAGQRFRRIRVEECAGLHLLDVREQNGQGFTLAPLACAQPTDDLRVGRVAEQVKPADALHGDDRPDAQQVRSAFQGG